MRKLLCIVLATVLIISMTAAVSAAPVLINNNPATVTSNPTSPTTVVRTGIKGINESDDIGDLLSGVSITVNDDSSDLSFDDLSWIEIAPGDVIKIPLTGNLFLDSNGNPFPQNANVSLSALSSGAISVRTSFSRGQGTYMASLVGNSSRSYIQLEFTEGVFLNAQKFNSSVYLARAGSRKASTKIVVAGEMQTVAQELYSGDDYADISDGSFVHANTMLRNVDLYLGDYCTITRTLARGATYAGIATVDDINGEDMLVLNKYPAIEYIYKLKTVGLKTTGNIVTFDLDRKYYVYDANGTYIGTSNMKLPYWTKYFLSDKKYEKLIIKTTK